MKKTRIAAFLLAALTLVPAVMTSCGSDDTTTTDTKADTAAVTEAETEPLDALDARKLVEDGVETKDFGGAPFRIVTSDNQTGYYWLEAKPATLSTMRSSAATPRSRNASTSTWK